MSQALALAPEMIGSLWCLSLPCVLRVPGKSGYLFFFFSSVHQRQNSPSFALPVNQANCPQVIHNLRLFEIVKQSSKDLQH